MDVTPQLLKEVEFREKFRGYDPDEVDDFLERVGTAFAQLHDRLRVAESQIESANSRAARAEASVRDNSDTDDTLRRTLVLAQRTADAAIKEAEENAAAIVAEAQTKARQHVAAAEERATGIKAEAEGELALRQSEAAAQSQTTLADADAQAAATMAAAREQANELLMDARSKTEAVLAEARTSADVAAEARRASLAAELVELEARREALSTNTELLDTHVNRNRLRIKAVIAQLEQTLEDPQRLAEIEAPSLVDEPTVSERAEPAAPEVPVLEMPALLADAGGDAATDSVVTEDADEAPDATGEAVTLAPETPLSETPLSETSLSETPLSETSLSDESSEDALPAFALGTRGTEGDVAATDEDSEAVGLGVATDVDGSNTAVAAASDVPVSDVPAPEIAADVEDAVTEPDAAVAIESPPVAAANLDSTAQVDMREVIASQASEAPSEGGRVPPPPPPPPRSLSARIGSPTMVPPPPAPSAATPSAAPPWAGVTRQSPTPPVPAAPPEGAAPGNSFFDELRKATGEEGSDDSVETALSFFDREQDGSGSGSNT